jgi:hypothetical protein
VFREFAPSVVDPNLAYLQATVVFLFACQVSSIRETATKKSAILYIHVFWVCYPRTELGSYVAAKVLVERKLD